MLICKLLYLRHCCLQRRDHLFFNLNDFSGCLLQVFMWETNYQWFKPERLNWKFMKSNAQHNGAVDIFPFKKLALFKLSTVHGLKDSRIYQYLSQWNNYLWITGYSKALYSLNCFWVVYCMTFVLGAKIFEDEESCLYNHCPF